MPTANQKRTIHIWHPTNITFSGNGVTKGANAYMEIPAETLDGELLITTDWEDTESALQITTEQLAFENREVVTNRFVSGKTVTIEYNMVTDGNQFLNETAAIRRDSIKGTFSLTMTYADHNGMQRVEGLKDCLLSSFNFTPNGQGSYNVKMMFKVLDSRKYVTLRDGTSYRSM